MALDVQYASTKDFFDRLLAKTSNIVDKKREFLVIPRQTRKISSFKNLDEMWDQVAESYSRCKSYADFNSFIISRLVQYNWGYDTLFVRLSDIPEVFEDGFKFLISNYKKWDTLAVNQSEEIFTSQGINTGVSSTLTLMHQYGFTVNAGARVQQR